jgi:NADPH2:quinone reductase
VQPGEHVLVHAAAGGLGGVCTQLAAAAGATVVATASTEAKQAIARENGAAFAFAPDPQTLRDRVRELTDGRGCDVVIDGVGGPLFAPSFEALANRGRYVVAGSTTQEPAMLDVRRLMPRNQTVVGFIVRRVIEVESAEPHATIDLVVDLVRSGSLRLPLTTLPLEQAAEAHRLLESRESTGKVVLAP